MGIGVLYGKDDHGFACLTDVDGDGGRSLSLPLTCLHRVGEKVAQDGAEVYLRDREALRQGDGGVHRDSLGLGGLYVVIEQRIGGRVLTVPGGFQSRVGAQIVIDILQSKVCLLLLQQSLDCDEMMTVIMAGLLELFQIILERGHLGFLYAGQQPDGPVLLLDRVAFSQPGQNPQTHIVDRVDTGKPADSKKSHVRMVLEHAGRGQGADCQPEHDEKEHRNGSQIVPDRKKPCVFHCLGQIFVQNIIGCPDHEKQKNKIAQQFIPGYKETALIKGGRSIGQVRAVRGGIREVLKKEKGIDVHRPVRPHHPFTDQYVGRHGGTGPRHLQPGPVQVMPEACQAQ